LEEIVVSKGPQGRVLDKIIMTEIIEQHPDITETFEKVFTENVESSLNQAVGDIYYLSEEKLDEIGMTGDQLKLKSV
jgi:hypothetical protein